VVTAGHPFPLLHIRADKTPLAHHQAGPVPATFPARTIPPHAGIHMTRARSQCNLPRLARRHYLYLSFPSHPAHFLHLASPAKHELRHS